MGWVRRLKDLNKAIRIWQVCRCFGSGLAGGPRDNFAGRVWDPAPGASVTLVSRAVHQLNVRLPVERRSEEIIIILFVPADYVIKIKLGNLVSQRRSLCPWQLRRSHQFLRVLDDPWICLNLDYVGRRLFWVVSPTIGGIYGSLFIRSTDLVKLDAKNRSIYVNTNRTTAEIYTTLSKRLLCTV